MIHKKYLLFNIALSCFVAMTTNSALCAAWNDPDVQLIRTPDNRFRNAVNGQFVSTTGMPDHIRNMPPTSTPISITPFATTSAPTPTTPNVTTSGTAFPSWTTTSSATQPNGTNTGAVINQAATQTGAGTNQFATTSAPTPTTPNVPTSGTASPSGTAPSSATPPNGTNTGAGTNQAATQTGAGTNQAATQTGAGTNQAATQTGAGTNQAATQTGTGTNQAATQTGTGTNQAATQTGAGTNQSTNQAAANTAPQGWKGMSTAAKVGTAVAGVGGALTVASTVTGKDKHGVGNLFTGAVGGLTTGMAIGSAVPVIGNGVGAIVGTVLGTAIAGSQLFSETDCLHDPETGLFTCCNTAFNKGQRQAQIGEYMFCGVESSDGKMTVKRPGVRQCLQGGSDQPASWWDGLWKDDAWAPECVTRYCNGEPPANAYVEYIPDTQNFCYNWRLINGDSSVPNDPYPALIQRIQNEITILQQQCDSLIQ